MKKKWRKLGRLYCPSGVNAHPKLLSHAANPLPLLLEGDVYRVFFSGRDALRRSSVGAVDINLVTREIVCEHHQPFFEYGPSGSFYAEGVSIGNCYEVDGKRYMLFMGWQNKAPHHWRGDIGRLLVHADLTLELDQEQPLMSVSTTDPISLSYPWVTQNADGQYHMWYGSTLTWDAGNQEMLHVIHHATSSNGHHWERHGLSVPYAIGEAQAFSRPTVAKDVNGLHMWFSYRSGQGETYRIGYAHRVQDQAWSLNLADVGIAPSEEGWDSEMMAYPFVLEHRNQRYMLYNGNGYGRTGFGLAIQETDVIL